MKSYRLGNYLISEGQVLGDGTFSRVFKGENQQGEAVAIKALTKCQETKQLIQDEVKIVKLLPKDSKNFCTYLDCHQTEKTFFIILTLCPGIPLSRRLDEGRLSTSLSVQIFRGLLVSVEELNVVGIMHHDIKPDNILLDKDRVRLVDFGFACKFDPKNDPLKMSLMRGTPAYMSPEILSGSRYNSKSDIWSLGVVLFQMVYGRMPFPGNNKTDILFNIYSKKTLFSDEDGIPLGLKNLMGKCLEIKVDKRINWKELFTWQRQGLLREEGKKKQKCCYCFDLSRKKES